ncbi:MAG: hypothetical protein AAFQ87_14415 [Bacteroidota bacterium]
MKHYLLLIGGVLLSLCSCQRPASVPANQGLNEVVAILMPQDSSEAEGSGSMFGFINNGNYLGALQDLVRNEASILAQFPPDMYYQSLGTALSKVGEYYTVLEAWNKQADRQADSVRQEDIELFLGHLELADAVEEIVAAASERQVVMINEAHHVPLHRVFTRSLLKDLYDQGYRYLAAETLRHSEIANLNETKIPGFRNGVYVSEPQYANLLREALDLGYELVAYEDQHDFNYSQRDSSQARNLAAVFARDPEAKMLVHAGYAHIYETTGSEWIKMGQYFQAFTGIDPLTINQTDLTEKGKPEAESPYYQPILEHYQPTEPKVIRIEGSYWILPNSSGLVDMQIIHPQTRMLRGRPNWVQTDNQEIRILANKLNGVLLAQVFEAEELAQREASQLIPVDQIIVKNPRQEHSLFVPPNGAYVVRLLNRDNEVVEQYKVQ